MSMMNTGDILETIEMFTQDNLDVRTVTMGISLLDCIDPDPRKACEKIYHKITTRAARLVPAVEHISAEYGIPIINKKMYGYVDDIRPAKEKVPNLGPEHEYRDMTGANVEDFNYPVNLMFSCSMDIREGKFEEVIKEIAKDLYK